MGWFWSVVACGLTACLGAAIGFGLRFRRLQRDGRKLIRPLLESHFHPVSPENITVSERKFPFRVRADLQRAIHGLFSANTRISYFCGIQRDFSPEGLSFSSLLVDGHSPAVSVPPQYEDVDVGDEQPVRCLRNGLWFLEQGSSRYAVLLSPAGFFHQITGLQFQIATANSKDGTAVAEAFFRHLEESVLKSESYRGKVLSLEVAEHDYSGQAAGIKVHRLRTVTREQVILPRKTLELLERNVIQFVQQRQRLAQFRQATKKGILFYEPPIPVRLSPTTFVSKDYDE